MAKNKKQRARAKQRPFPRYPLEKAIEVAQKIKELNGGEPWSPQSVATAVNIAQRSSNFQYLISSARDFGLINGNDRSEQISLTDLGREIAYAPDPKTELLKKREAFDKIDIFSKVLAHYIGLLSTGTGLATLVVGLMGVCINRLPVPNELPAPI